MRILYLYQYFVTPTHHGMTRAYEFARRLIDNGHDVHVVTSPGYLPDEYKTITEITHTEIDGVPCIIIPAPYAQEMSFARRIIAFLQFAMLASRVCITNKADLIYASSGPLTIAIPAMIGKTWQRIPMVLEVRDLWPEMPIAVGALTNPLFKFAARTLEWLAYHASAHVVALSPGMAEGVMKRGIDNSRVTVIPNSSDMHIFDVPDSTGNPIREQLSLTPTQPLVVYTGSFGLMNGVHFLAEVAAEMRDINPDCRFLLIGRGAEFENVKARAEELGVLGDNLEIWAAIPKVEIPKVLSAATVTSSIFLPIKEMWNNSANKFFDSLAASRPIAINYGGWQADIIAETGAGVVMDDSNAKLAAQQLNTFVTDEDKLAKGRKAAKELALERFDREKMAQKLEALLVEVADVQ